MPKKKKVSASPPPPPPTERLFGRRDFQIFLSRCEILDTILISSSPLNKVFAILLQMLPIWKKVQANKYSRHTNLWRRYRYFAIHFMQNHTQTRTPRCASYVVRPNQSYTTLKNRKTERHYHLGHAAPKSWNWWLYFGSQRCVAMSTLTWLQRMPSHVINDVRLLGNSWGPLIMPKMKSD